MEKVEMTSLVIPDNEDYRLIIVEGDKDFFGYYLVKVVAFKWVTHNSHGQIMFIDHNGQGTAAVFRLYEEVQSSTPTAREK